MKSLIVSDIHGNWSALEAVLAAEPDADQVLCLGDLVNYGPQPIECVSWAMSLNLPSRIIQGNHDRDFACGNEPHCSPASRPVVGAVSEATRPLLTLEKKQFLDDLKPIQEFRWGEALCVACHLAAKGPLNCPFEHQSTQWPWESDIILVGLAERPFTLVGHPDFLFVAHTHTPLDTRWGTTQVINPGSVGLPTDGDSRAGYAIWRDGEVEFRRVAYDVEQTVRAYEALNLNATIKRQLVESLRSGTRWAHIGNSELSRMERRGEPCHA